MFYKINVLKKFAKFTGNSSLESFLKKALGLQTLLKSRRLRYRRFPVNFVQFFKNIFLTEHLLATAFQIVENKDNYAAFFFMRLEATKLKILTKNSSQRRTCSY